MPLTNEQPPKEAFSRRVRESAAKLEQHIRACGLKPGDRYITTKEAGKLLGMSIVTAQRAMGLLAERNILERRPRAGTFIGDGIATEIGVLNIHFFTPADTVEGESGFDYGEQIAGMRSVLGDLSAHYHFVPGQSLEYIRQIVAKAAAADMINGAVLILPSREMRVFFNQSGIPSVVEGGIEPDLMNLCWLQWNQVLVGQLLTSWLLERGHRRLVTVMRDIWAIGEHLLHDGINEACSRAHLPANAVRMRSAPCERNATMELARSIFREEGGPTGVICRNEFQARCIGEVVRELGIADRVDIVHANAPADKDRHEHTCTIPDLSMFELGKAAGEMFRSLMANTIPEPRGKVIPVRLKCPPC